jgi:glyoxylase-like metal-dependent hydrolase (beta-lactamase superfamily II)
VGAAKSPLVYPFPQTPAPGEVVEIRPGVLWVRMGLPMALDHINLYLLEDHDGWWIVDTGLKGEQTRRHWEQVFATALVGKPVKALICTHCHPDHIGQAGWLSERWHAPLWMSYGEYYTARVFATPTTEGPLWEGVDFYRSAGAPESFLDRISQRRSGFSGLVEPLPRSFHRITDGEVLAIGGHYWEAVMGHGHSPEHLCLLDRARGLLLSGDQVIPIITSNVSVMAMEPEANPMAAWLDSHSRFLGLPEDVLVLPAHNTPFTGLHVRLRALIAHHEDHLEALETACTTPQTAMELLPVLFRRPLDGDHLSMALGECIAHLNLMRSRGVIVRERGADGLNRYRSLRHEAAPRETPARHGRDDDPLMEFEAEPI